MITFEDVKYKIVGFNKENGQLTIQYDGLDFLSTVDLPLTHEGLYIEGAVLDEYIRMMCPVHVINRKLALAAGIPNEDSISQLVEPLTDPIPSQDTPLPL